MNVSNKDDLGTFNGFLFLLFVIATHNTDK